MSKIKTTIGVSLVVVEEAGLRALSSDRAGYGLLTVCMGLIGMLVGVEVVR